MQTKRARPDLSGRTPSGDMLSTHGELGAQPQSSGAGNAHTRRSKGLGWFSIGLGAALVAAPRHSAKLIGVHPSRRARATMFLVGIREIAAGVGILAARRPAAWLWARMAGDVMDLALLGRSLPSRRSNSKRVTSAFASVFGVTALDAAAAYNETRSAGLGRGPRPIHVERAITVKRPIEEVYRFWHNFENLPRFMAHLESVQVVDGHSKWRARGPASTTIQWEADIVEDKAPELIAWRSREGADVPNEGQVRFSTAPGGRGTEVRVELLYRPPAGAFGVGLAKLLGREPGQQVEGDLRRFKQVMETGEVVHSDASIHSGQHAARSPEVVEKHDGKVVAHEG